MGTTLNLILHMNAQGEFKGKMKHTKSMVRVKVKEIPLNLGNPPLEWTFDQFARWFCWTWLPRWYADKGARTLSLP